MKGYMDSTNSLLDFLKAFESALEQRNSDLQLVKYRQNHLNVILKTLNYALKLIQEQLLQSTVYSCVELVELRYFKLLFIYHHFYKLKCKVIYN